MKISTTEAMGLTLNLSDQFLYAINRLEKLVVLFDQRGGFGFPICCQLRAKLVGVKA